MSASSSPVSGVEVAAKSLEPVTRLVNTEEGFDALQAQWQQLFSSNRNHTPFQTWEWNRTWWRHFGRAGDLRLYVVEEAGEIIGIAPLCLRRRLRGWKLPHLAFIAHKRSDYLDFLVQAGKEAAFFAALFTHLRSQTRPDWRLVDLRDVPETSTNLEPLLHGGLHASFALALQQAEACVSVPLLPTWEAYLASLGKNARRNVGRYRRQLADDYEVEWRIPNSEQELQQALEDFVTVYRERWRSTHGKTLFDSSATLAFERDICRLGASAGWYRLYMLYANAVPVAGYLGYVCNGKYYAGLLAYSPAFNRYSVGSTVIGLAIEDCIGHQWSEVDMMRGDEAFKYQWNGRRKCNYSVRLSSGRAALCLANAADWGFSALVGIKALHRLRAVWHRWRASAPDAAAVPAAPAADSRPLRADTASRAP